jgi:hypothetical protein
MGFPGFLDGHKLFYLEVYLFPRFFRWMCFPWVFRWMAFLAVIENIFQLDSWVEKAPCAACDTNCVFRWDGFCQVLFGSLAFPPGFSDGCVFPGFLKSEYFCVSDVIEIMFQLDVWVEKTPCAACDTNCFFRWDEFFQVF